MGNYIVDENTAPVTCDANDQLGGIRIIHISDTHNLHHQLKLPDGDILIHTGDFGNDGTAEEYRDFNEYLGKQVTKFKYGIFVVLGNHDFKFLNGDGHSTGMIQTMANEELRRSHFSKLLSNARVLDNECVNIEIKMNEESTHNLTIYGAPWLPWQSKPTYPDKLPKEGNGHYEVLKEWVKQNKIDEELKENPNFYDRIPDKVDILLSHVPPFGVFDQMPVLSNWGSSAAFLQGLQKRDVRALLFGHVHAQRGYWEKVKTDKQDWKIIGGCQYAKTTHDTRKEGTIYNLMMGQGGIQFIANSALKNDRTVQPFAKKRLVGKPRIIRANVVDDEWVFHDALN